MIDKVNAFLGRFVGPNAVHMIDAAVALGIAGGIALAASPAARQFEQRHSLLGVLVTIGVLLGTPLVSKFRKAAGGDATATAQQIADAVAKALAERDVPKQP